MVVEDWDAVVETLRTATLVINHARRRGAAAMSSHSGTLGIFKNRSDAGRQLAARLEGLIRRPCVIAAIPRGGVAVALPISERLAIPLTVSYARKLTDPRAPELAFGSLDEDGEAIIDGATVGTLGLRPVDIDVARAHVAAEIHRRIRLYRVPVLARFLPGPGVVLVDDGLATGLTMQAAVSYARRHGAREVTVAVPCASASAARMLGEAADRVVSLVVDEEFKAVGHYYADFVPVRDDEVVAVLARAAEHVASDIHDALARPR
jgi:putative phosphoribosyl transferase